MQVSNGIANPTNKVRRLSKSLYSPKQASGQWFSKLSDTLLSLGYQQFKNEYSLFLNKYDTDIIIVVFYVDDICIIGSNHAETEHVEQHIDTYFGTNDLEKL